MWRKRIKYGASPRRASLPPALSLPYVYRSQCGCYRLHLTDGQTTARGRGSCLAAKSRTRGCAGDARVRAGSRPGAPASPRFSCCCGAVIHARVTKHICARKYPKLRHRAWRQQAAPLAAKQQAVDRRWHMRGEGGARGEVAVPWLSRAGPGRTVGERGALNFEHW